jgi:hypothetical protein
MRDRHLEWALDLGAVSREPDVPSRELRPRDAEQRTESHHILDALAWADERGRSDDVFDLYGGSVGMLIDVDPPAAKAWFHRCPPPTTDVQRVLHAMYEMATAYGLGEPYGLIETIEEAAELLWQLPDDDLVSHGEGMAYVLLFHANRHGIIGDTDRELEIVAAMGELTARLPQLVDLEWARWQCTTDAYRRINDPRAVSSMDRALTAGLECRLTGYETARMFAAPTFFQFGEYERAVEIGLPCLHARIGTAVFRLNQIAPVAGSLAVLGRPDEALTVVDLDHGPLTGLVQYALRRHRAAALTSILVALGDDELVPALIGSSLAGMDRVSSAPNRFLAAGVVGGFELLDELIDAAEQQPESTLIELIDTAYHRASALVRG